MPQFTYRIQPTRPAMLAYYDEAAADSEHFGNVQELTDGGALWPFRVALCSDARPTAGDS